jgi:hypothetical protein
LAKKQQKAVVSDQDPRIEYVSIDELPPWPRNPKLHDRDSTKESLMRFGFTAPVLVDEGTGRLVAGHGRIEALQELRAEGAEAPARIRVDGDSWLVPVVRGLHFASAQEAEAYLLADNRLVEKGGWDDNMLKTMLEDLQRASTEDADVLAGLGWSDKEVAALIRLHDDEHLSGPTPEERLDGYINAGIKQIILFFSAKDYDSVVGQLNRLQEVFGVKSHTEVVMELLSQYAEGEEDDGDDVTTHRAKA